VLPAKEGFDCEGPTVVHVDDGLVEDPQLAAFERSS